MFRDTRSRLAAALVAVVFFVVVPSAAAAVAPPPPTNDGWANATALSGAVVTQADANHWATNEVNEPLTDGTLRLMSVWYSWVSPVDGNVQIDTCNTVTTDMYLGVFGGNTIDTLGQVAAADEGCAGAGPSRVTFTAAQGTQYSINVAMTGADPSSDFELSILTSPALVDPPGITGDGLIGQVLTGYDGVWDGATPIGFAREWQRCDEFNSNCVAIPGETGTTYTPVEADRGHVLRYQVTPSNSIGSAPPDAPATSVIDSDTDGDLVPDSIDNCLTTANLGQEDYDNDSYGDSCDADDDEDGVSDVQELSQGMNPLSQDTDMDGTLDGADECPLLNAAGADGCPIPVPPAPGAPPAPPAPPAPSLTFNAPAGPAGNATVAKGGVVTVPKTTVTAGGGASTAAYAVTGRYMALVAKSKGKRKKLTLIATTSFTVHPGQTVPVTLTLTNKGLAVLRKVKRMSGKISLVARMPDGTTKTATVSFTLVAPK